jgi:holo-[acyl-carrier protein] synthase
MELEIKEIIAPFVAKSVDSITPLTAIDRNALRSSIFVHRMYSRLTEKGYVVADYSNIKNFGDLMNKLHLSTNTTDNKLSQVVEVESYASASLLAIGIDIEEVSSIPKATDFRTHEFFVQTFSKEEISHCILQSDPYASFAGLFAAKEAIIKANNSLIGFPLHSIPIQFTETGKPFHKDLELSISHTNELAIAVAVTRPMSTTEKVATPNNLSEEKKSSLTWILSLLALLLSILTFLIILKT